MGKSRSHLQPRKYSVCARDRWSVCMLTKYGIGTIRKSETKSDKIPNSILFVWIPVLSVRNTKGTSKWYYLSLFYIFAHFPFSIHSTIARSKNYVQFARYCQNGAQTKKGKSTGPTHWRTKSSKWRKTQSKKSLLLPNHHPR